MRALRTIISIFFILKICCTHHLFAISLSLKKSEIENLTISHSIVKFDNFVKIDHPIKIDSLTKIDSIALTM